MVSFSDNNSDLGNAGYLGFELPGESAIERAIDRFETGKINFGVLNASGQDVLVDRIFEVDRLMDEDADGRKNYLFVGSQAGGKAAAIAYTLIETAKLNGIDPQAWLADTLACIPDYKITRINDLLPWRIKQ